MGLLLFFPASGGGGGCSPTEPPTGDALNLETGDHLLLETCDHLLLEDLISPPAVDKVFPWLRPPQSLAYLLQAAARPSLVKTVPLITEQIWRWITTRYPFPRWEPQVNFPRVPRIFRTVGWDTPTGPGGTWDPFPIPIGSGDWDCPPALTRFQWEPGCCTGCGAVVTMLICGTCGTSNLPSEPCPNGWVAPSLPDAVYSLLRLENTPAQTLFGETARAVEAMSRVIEASAYAQYDLIYVECDQDIETACVAVTNVTCTGGGGPEWEFVEFIAPPARHVFQGYTFTNEPTLIGVIESGDQFDNRLFSIDNPGGRLFGFRLTNLDPTALDPGDDCQATAIVTDDCDLVGGPPVETPTAVARGTKGFVTGFEEEVPSITQIGWDSDAAVVEVVRNGIDTTHSVYLPDSGNQRRIDTGVTAQIGEPLYVRAYFKFTNTRIPPGTFSESPWQLSSIYTAGGTAVFNVRVVFDEDNAEGNTWEVNCGIGATTRGTYALVDETWYRLEYECVRGSSPNGSITARLYLGDSETILETLTAVGDTDVGATVLRIGHAVAAGHKDVEYWFDDIIVSPGGWIGPGTIHTLPAVSEVSTQWTPDGAYTNLEAIEGVPGTGLDETTNNKATSVGLIDRYRFLIDTMDYSKKVNYTQPVLRGKWSGGGGTVIFRSKEWDNTGAVWNGVDYPVSFAIFNSSNAVMLWNDIPVLQFYGFNVGYESVTVPGGTTIHAYNFWYNVNIH